MTSILSRHWAGAGHEVKILTLAPETSRFYRLHPKVTCEALDLAAESATGWGALVGNLRRLRALRHAIRAHRTDVAIGIMSSASVLVALACLGLRCRTIGTERTYPPRWLLPRAWHCARRISYRFLDVIIAQTDDTAKWLRVHTGAKCVSVIPNPVAWPLEETEPTLSPQETCTESRKIVLAVGRLGPEKRFSRLIRSFAAIQASHPSWDLVILGEGPEKPLLESQRDQLGLAGRIFLPGRAGNVGAWYDRASVFAMTSEYEGFPNALLEAMAYGLPAISVNCDTGPRDIIRPNIDGILVPADDDGRFAEGLARLLDDAHLRLRFAARAQEVRDRYSEGKILGMWQAIFEKLGLCS